MTEPERQLPNRLPSDIAAIGAELSAAIREDHQRSQTRRMRSIRALVVVAILGVGSGTALAARDAFREVPPAKFANPCLRAAVAHPGRYKSLEDMDRRCGFPTKVATTPPPKLPSLPTTNAYGGHTAHDSGHAFQHHDQTASRPQSRAVDR